MQSVELSAEIHSMQDAIRQATQLTKGFCCKMFAVDEAFHLEERHHLNADLAGRSRCEGFHRVQANHVENRFFVVLQQYSEAIETMEFE